MKFPKALGVSLALFGMLYGFQLPFREFPGVEYRVGDISLPADWQEKTEWAFARLMYPNAPGGRGGYGRGFGFRGGGVWTEGGTIWTQDYPRADRHFSRALRRLSRIDVRSVEQVVNLDDDDVYNWPWIYAVQVGEWGMTEKEGAKLRDYLQRGGFFMADDFHGFEEWREFEKRIKFAFPDRPIIEMQDDDPYFHTVYDIADRPQVPGADHLGAGCKACQSGGTGAHWRGIYDDKGRVMVAISFNSDLGDAWEYADSPYYPEKFSALAIRVTVNDVIYAMTH